MGRMYSRTPDEIFSEDLGSWRSNLADIAKVLSLGNPDLSERHVTIQFIVAGVPISQWAATESVDEVIIELVKTFRNLGIEERLEI